MKAIYYRQTVASRTFDILNYIFLGLLGLLFLYPFWDTLILSVSTPENTDVLGLRLFTWPVTFFPYNLWLKTGQVYTGYYNTLFRTIIGTTLTVFVTYFAAYSLAKRELPLRTFLTIFILFTMFFQGGLIPKYLNMQWLGLLESRWSLILPLLTSAWYLILTRNFIMSLPKELEDAAIMDGANPIKMIFYIMLPLSMPIIAVLTLWVSVSHWNQWFDCLLYIHDPEKAVLQIMLQRIVITEAIGSPLLGDADLVEEFMGKEKLPRTIRAAAVMVTIGPIILAYPFLQKYFVKGIMIGSLKG